MRSLYTWGQDTEISTEGFFGRFLPGVHVEEEGGIITVSGIWTDELEKAANKHWKTTKVFNHMFFNVSTRTLRFYSFYAVEFIYILNTVIKESKTWHGYKKEFRKTINKMYEDTWLRSTKISEPLDMDLRKLKILNKTMLKHQMEAYENYASDVPRLDLKGYLMHMGTGTGKTLTGYGFSLVFGLDLQIIVCPKSTVINIWKKTIDEEFKTPQQYWHSMEKRAPDGREKYLICHYESLDKLMGWLGKFKRRKNVGIWLDESHNFTIMKSNRVQLFLDLVEKSKSKHTVWASATPLRAMPSESIPLIKSIDPRFNDEAAESYTKIFGASKSASLDIVNHRLSLLKFRVDKKDVKTVSSETFDESVQTPNGKDYTLDVVSGKMRKRIAELAQEHGKEEPEINKSFYGLMATIGSRLKTSIDKDNFSTYKEYAIDMNKGFSFFVHKDALLFCKKFEKETVYSLLDDPERKIFKRVAPRFKYISLVHRGMVLGQVLLRERIKCFIELALNARLERFIEAAIKKTLIFTSYVEVAKAVNGYLTELGYEPLIVIGETNKDLPAIMNKLSKDPKANPITATYQSLSTGNEVVEASTVIFLDLPFRSIIMDQARGRVDRISQDTDVTYINILLDTGTETNLASRNLEIMDWSGGRVEAMLGDSGDTGLIKDPALKEEIMRFM